LNGNQDIELLTRPQPLIAESSDPWQLAARPSFKKLLHVLADTLALLAGYMATGALLWAEVGNSSQRFDILRYAFFLPFVLVVLHLFGAYGSDLRRPDRELELLFKGTTVSFAALFIGLGILTDNSLRLTAYFVSLWGVSTLVFLICGRFLLRFVYGTLWSKSLARTRVLLIGSPEPFLMRERWLSFQKHTSYEVVRAILPDEVEDADGIGESVPMLEDTENWTDLIEAYQVQSMVFDFAAVSAQNYDISPLVKRCRRAGVDVMFFDSRQSDCKGDCEYDSALMHAQRRRSPRVQMMIKRLIDMLFGVAGSLVTLLLTPIIGLLINLEDPGPVFHRREFVSEDGSLKYYLKFRTMLCNADDILENDPHLKARFVGNYKLQEDPRVLRVGRFLRKYSVDEFPQFFSLLTNRLTLVGPRVICEAEKDRYGDLLPKRLSVKPGITGYWQVMGRQTTTYEERVRLDIFYIEQWSIWLDLVIIAKTLATIIRPEGAY
jgi:lipopolysaccharide/colanic/teichoic acid biosynthesis glycosyltransferase